MKHKPCLFTIFRKWKHLSAYSGKKVINNLLALSEESPDIVEYSLEVNPRYELKGKSILFFSDTHFKIDSDSLFFPELIQKTKPDYIVFGGDLITHACFIKDAFAWLKKNFADFEDIPKFAIPGNWDRRRKTWFPLSIWYEKYSEVGFELLVNQEKILNKVRFYGVDEPRCGQPILEKEDFSKSFFNVILSHCVDPVIETATANNLPGHSLALCGHSHGGQIRIPYFGALFTSSDYWKLFEYGLYENKNSNMNMILTSGLGMSRFSLRLFCEPETVIVKFI